MSLVPRTVADRIQYYETQLPAWANVAEEIGSSPEEGATRVTYKLQAVRSTKVGACALFNVNFGGVSPGGAAVQDAPRLAA